MFGNGTNTAIAWSSGDPRRPAIARRGCRKTSCEAVVENWLLGAVAHPACDVDVAVVGRQFAHEDLHQCALAGSVLSDEADNLSGANIEVCAAEHGQFAPTRPHPSSIRLRDARRH